MGETHCLACVRGVPKRGRRRCPECARAFRGSGWDGVEAHWNARHADRMPYERFWSSLCRAHRARRALECPCCAKGMPREGPTQCPECALVFKGKGWEGLDAHWKSKHPDVMSYDDFLGSLCPAHRKKSDRTSGFLPLGRR
jgi:predicted amidophosphoribosyltransferase